MAKLTKLLLILIIFFLSFSSFSSTDKKKDSFIFKSGYIFPFTKSNLKFWLPHFAFAYRYNAPKSDKWFFELEIGYIPLKKDITTGNYGVYPEPTETARFHGIPLSFNILRQIELASWFELNPKLGLGFMTSYSTNPTKENGFSVFFLLKPGLELSFRVSESWYILLDNTFLIAQDVKDDNLFKNKNLYYIPSLGARYSF
ncbi:MAG: hypothetical protein OEV44_11870 [Spirochaetota bacterium]|nr:hypothetical protein [Spirochaetota bacterium]